MRDPCTDLATTSKAVIESVKTGTWCCFHRMQRPPVIRTKEDVKLKLQLLEVRNCKMEKVAFSEMKVR